MGVVEIAEQFRLGRITRAEARAEIARALRSRSPHPIDPAIGERMIEDFLRVLDVHPVEDWPQVLAEEMDRLITEEAEDVGIPIVASLPDGRVVTYLAGKGQKS